MIQSNNKATRIKLASFSSPPMRAFHMSWVAFFLCFFAWFGVAPLMSVVREEMALTKEQIGWCLIGSVGITILARLFIGWLCDRIGPRLAYTSLLVLGSLPVMGIGFARDFQTFLLFRVLIGAIGASFVITQYHTSIMFAPNCVGTANATTAGWGNLGGGVTQMAMPALFALFVGTFGMSESSSWRAAMVVAGVICLLMGIAYYLFTQDTPDGNFHELRSDRDSSTGKSERGAFLTACRDPRVWALFLIYGACFGVELTINNIAALYFLDYFSELRELPPVDALRTAGLLAGIFGLMNLFARTLGGAFGDWSGRLWGLKGRVKWLFVVLIAEGIALMTFAQTSQLIYAIPTLIVFSVMVQMAEGATFAVVPFINQKALGSVSGIVGAGGNAGAVAAGFLFKSAIPWPTAMFLLGVAVTIVAFSSFVVTFSAEAETEAKLAQQAVGHPHQGELVGVT